MTLLALIIIAVAIGYIHGTAYGFLALGIGMFLTVLLRAILNRIPITRSGK